MNDHGFTVVAYNRTSEKGITFSRTKPRARKFSARIRFEEMVSKPNRRAA